MSDEMPCDNCGFCGPVDEMDSCFKCGAMLCSSCVCEERENEYDEDCE